MTPTPQRKNSETTTSLSLKEIADLVGGELVGDPSVAISGVAGIKEAGKGEITFLSNVKYIPYLDQTRASAVITFKDTVSVNKPLIRTSNPSQAFTKVVSVLRPFTGSRATGSIHPTAVVHPGAKLGQKVSVGPYAVIEEGVNIGEECILEAHTFIGAGCRLGRQVHLYPMVTIREETEIGDRVIIHSGTVIGSDGFGYETIDGRHVKIPQTGTVLIEDDVEIGANVCIDRGRFQKTTIRRGVKIDNLVQIAHNVIIGENSLVISQAGISGSSELGKNVIVAGQAGIVGHVTLGDETIVGAGAGVTKSWPSKSVILGSPAKAIAEQKKLFVFISRLPDLFKEFAELKKKFEKKR